MIKNLLLDSEIEDNFSNRIVAHIESIIDAKYLNPDGVSKRFNGWVEHLPSSQMFEVVQTKDRFTAISYKERYSMHKGICPICGGKMNVYNIHWHKCTECGKVVRYIEDNWVILNKKT